MDALVGYASSDEEARRASGSSGSDSEASSLDSATRRAAEADARLKDFHKERGAVPVAALPSAFSAFDEVDGPPEFLDPEAIRRLAHATHARSGAAASADGGGGAHGGGQGSAPGADFDVSRLAPKLKGDRKRPTGDTRDLPASAVIQGKAKRNRIDGPEASQAYSAATIAMLGGTVNEGASGSAAAAAALAGPRLPSAPMAVSDFLDKGGGQLLPRKAQDRRDKEKDKRMKGQSAIGSWKSEAEMVLRQQFDS